MKKIRVEITSWLNESVLFEYESKDNTLKQTLEKAVNKGANLWGADLRGAKNINSDQTDYWWHIHHERLYEYLTEPIRARINYIKKEKPKGEIELRLKLLKPVLGKIPTTEKGWEALHKKECKDCPWRDGTTFPDKKKSV